MYVSIASCVLVVVCFLSLLYVSDAFKSFGVLTSSRLHTHTNTRSSTHAKMSSSRLNMMRSGTSSAVVVTRNRFVAGKICGSSNSGGACQECDCALSKEFKHCVGLHAG
jgi:hypothetical protein